MPCRRDARERCSADWYPGSRLQSLCMSGRLLITGVDASGGSCAAQNDRIALQGDATLEGILYSVLYATPSLPSISTGGGRDADILDLGVPAGALRWAV